MIIAQKYNGYSDLHNLPTHKGYQLIAIVGKDQTVYAEKVIIESIEIGFGSCWDRLFPTIRTGGTVLNAQIQAVLAPDEQFTSPQEWSVKISRLIEFGLSPNHDLVAFQKAIAARDAINAAFETYRATMASLGAVRHSEGNYEDFHSWFEIPNVPGCWVDH